jgi:hypothetical protein
MEINKYSLFLNRKEKRENYLYKRKNRKKILFLNSI